MLWDYFYSIPWQYTTKWSDNTDLNIRLYEDIVNKFVIVFNFPQSKAILSKLVS